MQIRLKKGRDGPDSLSCVRDDGTSTWRRIQRGLAVHDLTHYAVETELALSDGFFALVADGWSLDDLAAAEERSRIPPGAVWVELLVNQFLTEAMSGELYDEDSFHANVALSAERLAVVRPRRIQGDEIARIRGSLVTLVARWRALAMGETLELPFDSPRASPRSGKAASS